jgi:Immunity protein 42
MPLFGETSRFAVEYDLDAKHGGAWMFGRFCYWSGGRRVGDYELGTPLRDVLFQLDEIAKYGHLRTSQRFSAMPAILVFRLLDGALFGGADLNNAHVAAEEQWANHQIIPGVDVFLSWKGYLVEDEKTARVIFARAPYLEVSELSLKTGEVDAVLNASRNALDEIYRQP